ncbi:MAG: ATP-dependent DNA helicase DinG [Legionellales bacterium RIFCSPHIGHO2_12_FULL_35_11]|nr:MAG: ATP-dependent DNA helicase DinG [Legionellales bacterium RIFCSPHIGHO2_12_FULL_35_11]
MVKSVLSKGGRLTTAISNFVFREPQVKLALAIADTILAKSILIAEAGTGTGKTFAYLTPSLLSGEKTIITTATKTLQDQLVDKDLPILINGLGIAKTVQNLKGRSNYICKYRTKLHAKEGRFSSPECVRDILHVYENMARLRIGERSELPDVSEESMAWPYVCSTAENCLGRECEEYADCFLVKARQKAINADIVVTNHHLFFADSRLKNEGFGEILPKFHTVIFDEAHKLAEIYSNFHGSGFSTRQLQDLISDIIREYPPLELVSQPLVEYSRELDSIIDLVRISCEKLGEKISYIALQKNKEFQSAIQQLSDFIVKLLICINEVNVSEQVGLARCNMRAKELQQLLLKFNQDEQNSIRWVESFKRSVVFHITPVDIANDFRELLETNKSAYIFTSATISIAASFSAFTESLGIKSAKVLSFASPFNFQEQAILYLPRGMPDPKSANYNAILIQQALPIINACEGRCFFLFTSHKALRHVATILKNQLRFPLLVQGDESKPILLARFRQLGNAVLLGTSTFWEGVDVRGEALSCVIIDKLPFASPTDPVIRGKMAYLESQGISSFDKLSLPNAVISLKQGVGRLIRDVSDTGVLLIADPRLTSRNYGEVIFSSLPFMQKTRDEAKVLTFIKEMVLNNEFACN